MITGVYSYYQSTGSSQRYNPYEYQKPEVVCAYCDSVLADPNKKCPYCGGNKAKEKRDVRERTIAYIRQIEAPDIEYKPVETHVLESRQDSLKAKLVRTLKRLIP